MARVLRPDLCIIGAGSGGLSVAAGAAQLGAEVVLLEPGAMGGDCLNVGCVPSKSLLAAGHAAHAAAGESAMGVRAPGADVDFAAAHRHVQSVIAGIAPHDSQERFEGLGVTVLRTSGRFVDAQTLEADGTRIQPRRFVIATGSRPAVPPIPGLDTVPYLTNETLFDLDERPDHLIIIGGGAIGVEMAAAHRRLGARVTVLEMDRILPRDDAELAHVVVVALGGEGVDFVTGAQASEVSGRAGEITVSYAKDGREARVTGSHLLVATGRRPNVENIGLEAAGIAFNGRGITVDRRLRTSNRKVFAAGDVAGPHLFTHAAGYHAGVIIRNALFAMPAKVDYAAMPHVTYAEPELAQVGLTEAEARSAHGDAVRVTKWPLAENDRARAERKTEGLIKVVTGKRGRILGAGIVGQGAGDLITPWILAINRKLNINAMAGIIAPYPTFGEVTKRVAGEYFTDALFSPRTRRLVGVVQKLP